LLIARLREQLKGGRAPKTSKAELRRDWKLLKAAFDQGPEDLTARVDFRRRSCGQSETACLHP